MADLKRFPSILARASQKAQSPRVISPEMENAAESRHDGD